MSAFVFVRTGPGEPMRNIIGGAGPERGVSLLSCRQPSGWQGCTGAGAGCVGSPEDSDLLVWRVCPPGTVGIICPQFANTI